MADKKTSQKLSSAQGPVAEETESGDRRGGIHDMSIKGATTLIPSKIQSMLKDYAEDLEQAWTKAGEDPLTISFSAKIGVAKGKNLCEVSMSFTKEKVKDSITFEWSPKQGELFETIEGIDDRLKKEETSMTISSPGGESVTLGNRDEDLPDADKNGYMMERQSETEE